MRINNNLMAMNTHRMLGINNNATSKSVEKLSSGYRINRAGDDAAGLAISEKMRGQIRGLNKASRNAQDSISLVQTAEGALNETQAILQRMRELAVQSANDTNVDADRTALQNEIDQLATEMTRISNDTEFNERKLLNGGLQDGNIGELTFHIGANSQQNVALGIGALDAKSLGVSADVESTGATLTADANFLGAEIAGTSYFEEGDYTLEIDAAGTKLTLANSDGEVIASGTRTADAYEVITLTDADGDSLDVALASAATSADTITVSIGANGINLDDADTSEIETAQLTSGTLDEGSYSLRVIDETTDGTDTNAQLLNAAGDVIETIDIGSAAAADDLINETLAFTVDGESVTIDVSLNGLATSVDSTVSFEVVDKSYVSGTSDAATFAAGELNEKADVMKGIDITTQSAADAAITTINTALTTVSDERAKLGAVQNRLEHTIKNLDTSAENLQASESRIRDVDMAAEMMEFTKNNILQQAAQSMLAQANQQPQGVLQLLR